MELNEALQQIARRAERNDPEILRNTFVSIGGVASALRNPDHKIIFGRRGTGKTHALIYQKQEVSSSGDLGIFIDLRVLGSDGSVYNDNSLPVAQRATRLLIDFLLDVHEQIQNETKIYFGDNGLSSIAEAMNDFIDTVYRVEIIGTSSSTDSESKESTRSLGVDISAGSSSMGARISSEQNAGASKEKINRDEGQKQYRVHFSTIRNGLSNIAELLGCQIWLLIDEWSSIPQELQPFLADMIRKCIFPIRNYTAVIAAIEHRAVFSVPYDNDYIGIELGSDASSSINLDDFMVFENDPKRSHDFFSDLLYRHCSSIGEFKDASITASPQRFMRACFSSKEAQSEFIKSAEGVPRDAIHIINRCAQRAGSKKISMANIRAAARDWFQQDKSDFLKSNQEADYFLRWIIDRVIGERKARAFLVQRNQRSKVIDTLFDNRLVHILRRSVSAHEETGARYTAYKLDYGCYVELMNTKKKPIGLLPNDDKGETFVDVPDDDYRAIRRAILDLDEFDYEKLRNEFSSKKLRLGEIGDAIALDMKISNIMRALIVKRHKERDRSQPDLFDE